MTDLRNQLVLPPAQQIEELTKDVNKLQQEMQEVYVILDNMAATILNQQQMIGEMGQLILIMRRGGVDVGRESSNESDGTEGSTGALDGSGAAGATGTLSD